MNIDKASTSTPSKNKDIKKKYQAPSRKVSVCSVHCRICYDNEKEEELIAPCHCKGTVAFIHRSCLETWLSESGITHCELCHQSFKTERTPKYTSGRSIWHWLRYGPRFSGEGLRGDLIACTVITPLAIIITYVCLYSSEYYGQQKFSQIPAARWTSISLLFMIGIMLFGYYLWVYSVIRMHARMWYSWWQRCCIVRYIPPSTISLNTRAEEQAVLVPNNTPNPPKNDLEDLSDTDSLTHFESVINIVTPEQIFSHGEGLTETNNENSGDSRRELERNQQNDVVIDIYEPCVSDEVLDLK